MPEKVTLTRDDVELVQSFTTAGQREPQAVTMSLHHLTFAAASAGGAPHWMHFLLQPHLAQQLAEQLLSAAREASATH